MSIVVEFGLGLVVLAVRVSVWACVCILPVGAGCFLWVAASLAVLRCIGISTFVRTRGEGGGVCSG